MISGLKNYFEALHYLNTLELCNVLCSFLLLRSATVVCIRNETFLEEIFEIIKEKVFVSFIISNEFTRHEGFDKTWKNFLNSSDCHFVQENVEISLHAD